MMWKKETLPSYVVVNDPACENRDVLRNQTELVSFPLDEATQEVVRILEKKFDAEENCAGLAAPQIGFSKRILVLAAEDDDTIKKYRPDFSDTLPKSIWINPSYKPLTAEKTEDWEACFSVGDLVGKVARFTQVSYEAWTPEGKKVTGKARGFLARIIQHEIDHLDGILFIDRVIDGQLMTRDEFYEMRENM